MSTTILDQIAVDQIREIYAAGRTTQRELGLQFGVHPNTIGKVLHHEAPFDREVVGGRTPRRVQPKGCRLSLADIDEARRCYSAGQRDIAALATQFEISSATMTDVLLARNAYQKTGHPVMRMRREGQRITEQDQTRIRELFNNGMTKTQISALYEISTSTITGIVKQRGCYAAKVVGPDQGQRNSQILSLSDSGRDHNKDAIVTNFLADAIREVAIDKSVDSDYVRGQIDLVVASLGSHYDAARVRENVIAFLTGVAYRPLAASDRNNRWHSRHVA